MNELKVLKIDIETFSRIELFCHVIHNAVGS